MQVGRWVGSVIGMYNCTCIVYVCISIGLCVCIILLGLSCRVYRMAEGRRYFVVAAAGEEEEEVRCT